MKEIEAIEEIDLIKSIQGKKWLYPLVGILGFIWVILVIPFFAIHAFRHDAIKALRQCLALTLCRVK